ncbi:STY0301 family protein [Snodgrassella alvi]|uniref:STY0301 family protein n=1 Tax=Snodgrassella alvi TaxID=1196083 RepID=UPI003CFC0527
MISMNFIRFNTRKLPQYLLALFFNIVSINCLAQTPVVSCPSSFSDAHGVHKLDEVYAYDGPVCMKVSLVPEYKKNKQVWDLDALRDPSLVCTYENTEHYVVINAKGAAYCEKTNAPVEVKCMPR